MTSRVVLEKVSLEKLRVRGGSPSLGQRLANRLVVVLLAIGVWSVVMAAHLEGPWLVLGPIFAIFAAAILVARWRARAGRVTLTLGNDGIYLEERSSNRFIPFADLVRVTRGASGLTLRARGAPLLVLHAARPEGDQGLGDLVDRIEEARVAAGGLPADAPLAFERGHRSIPEWMSELRGLLKRDGYRESSVDPPRLWAMVESPALEPSHRAAAAVALRDHLGTEGKARLRVAAEACASPKVRVALEAAAEDDDEKLSLALERIEGDP
jgi:hypothetical protein